MFPEAIYPWCNRTDYVVFATSAMVIVMLDVFRHPLVPIKDIWLTPTDEPELFPEMTLREHLEEFRIRLVRACLAIGAAFIVGLILAPHVLRLIKRQAHATTGFDILSPTEPFTDFMKVALYIGVTIAIPVIVYEIVAYLAPGLTRRERRVLYTALPFVSLLFIAGACFAFFIAAPRAFTFLSNFDRSVFLWSPQGEEVISFYLTLMIGMGLAFELPILMYMFARLHIVSATRFRGFRRYAVVLILVAAAIITPTPDPFNMMVVATPMLLLYEVGVLLAHAA